MSIPTRISGRQRALVLVAAVAVVVSVGLSIARAASADVQSPAEPVPTSVVTSIEAVVGDAVFMERDGVVRVR